jgi:hypothetical protein
MKWTPEQNARLEQIQIEAIRTHKRIDYPSAAAEFETTIKAVEQKLFYLRKCKGLASMRGRDNYRWTAEDIEELRQLRHGGMAYKAIALRFPGATPKACEKQYQKLIRTTGEIPFKRARDPNAGNSWTEDEESAVQQYLAAGLTWAEIAKRLHRSVAACKTRFSERRRGQRGGPIILTTRREAVETARQQQLTLPQPASITAWVCGDPLPGRSALDQKRQASRERGQ